MVARVQKTPEGYAIVLTEDALKELKLAEGSAVEIHPVEMEQVAMPIQKRYASTEEVLEIYHRTKERFRHAYEELAK